MFYTLVNLFSYVDSEECLNKFQSFDGFHQPSLRLFRTTTPLSRDSGIPIPSSSASSCGSPTFERASTPRSSFTPQERVWEFFLHPPTQTPPRHLSYPLNKSRQPMSSVYDSTSHRRNVHWNDQSLPSSPEENDYLDADLTHVKKCGRQVSLSTSLPFYSKLNIRIRTHRDELNDNDRVKATASIQRIDPQHDHEHNDSLRQAHSHHYSTISLNENINTRTRIDAPYEYNRLPPRRQVSLPIALPINQQLVLYIRNGEVFARC